MNSINHKEHTGQVDFGNPHHLKMMFDLWYKELSRFSYKITGSIEDAEEIIQDVFIKCNHKQYKTNSLVQSRALLYKMVKNSSCDLVRKKKRASKLESEFEDDNVIISEIDANQKELQMIELLSAVFSKMKYSMQPRERETLYLRIVRHLDTPEVAKVMNISYQRAKNHFSCGLSKIKEACLSDRSLCDLAQSFFKLSQ